MFILTLLSVLRFRMRSDTEGIDLFWRARPTELGPETENENQASGIWGSINRGV